MLAWIPRSEILAQSTLPRSRHLCLDMRRVPVGLPGGASDKKPTCQGRRHKRCRFEPCVGKIPWRKTWQPTPVFSPGESHGQRSLEGYSPWDRKETDRTKVTEHTPHTHTVPHECYSQVQWVACAQFGQGVESLNTGRVKWGRGLCFPRHSALSTL